MLVRDEIAEFETWLGESLNKEPRPTEDMISFIQKSNAHQAKLQRRRFQFSIIVSVVLFLFLIFAIFQAIIANNESARANQEANGQYEQVQTLGLVTNTRKIDLDAASLSSPLLLNESLWVTAYTTTTQQVTETIQTTQEEGQLYRLAVHTGEVIATFDVGKSAQPPKVYGDFVWVLNAEAAHLTVINTLTNEMQRIENLPASVENLIYRDDAIYVLINNNDVLRIDRISGDITATLDEAEYGNQALLDDGRWLWLLNSDTGLWRIDPATATMQAITPETNIAKAVYRGEEQSWLLTADAIIGVDDTGEIVSRSVGRLPEALYSDADNLWIAVQNTDSAAGRDLLRFDLQQGEITERIALNEPIRRMMPIDGDFWFTTSTDELLRYSLGDLRRISFNGSGRLEQPTFDGEVLWFAHSDNHFLYRIDVQNERLLPALTDRQSRMASTCG